MKTGTIARFEVQHENRCIVGTAEFLTDWNRDEFESGFASCKVFYSLEMCQVWEKQGDDYTLLRFFDLGNDMRSKIVEAAIKASRLKKQPHIKLPSDNGKG